MDSVGVRELRQRASELLRMVEAGKTVQITDRGRPVAVLAPIPEGPLARMRAAGELDLAGIDDPFEPALVIDHEAESPSAVLERLRRDER